MGRLAATLVVVALVAPSAAGAQARDRASGLGSPRRDGPPRPTVAEPEPSPVGEPAPPPPDPSAEPITPHDDLVPEPAPPPRDELFPEPAPTPHDELFTEPVPAPRADEAFGAGSPGSSTPGGFHEPGAPIPPSPSASVPLWTGPGVTVRVRVEGSSRLSLHDVRPGRAREMLCAAPCELHLERGAWDFGIALGDGAPVRTGGSHVELEDDAVLTLEHVNRDGLRVAGWMMFGIGLPLGSLLIFTSLFSLGLPLLISASIFTAFALVFWLVAGFHDDHLDIRREPLTVRF